MIWLNMAQSYKFLKNWIVLSGIMFWIMISVIFYGVYFQGGELCILTNEIGEMPAEIIMITLINIIWVFGLVVGVMVK